MLYRGRGGGRDRPTRHAKVGGLGKHQDRTAKLRSLPTAGELGRIIERGSEKWVHLALCLRRGHVLGWAKRPLPPAVHQYIYGPFKPVECRNRGLRSEEHTYELQSLMRISYAVFCLQTQKKNTKVYNTK